MKDIFGEDYLIISRYDYQRLLDRIDELEKVEQEYREYVTNLANQCNKQAMDAFAETAKFLMNNNVQINITEKDSKLPE